MSADVFVAAFNTFGPFVLVAFGLIWVILRSPSGQGGGQTPPGDDGFDAKQKLYLREHLLDPIIEAINRHDP